MCGIAGYTGRHVTGRLESMMRRIAHRGPDGSGVFEEGRFHLGVRRLAIVDLETGGQPKYSADRNVVVFLNGEIYNAPELRRTLEAEGIRFESRSSDTEVIAHLFARDRLGFVDKLIGMFAICIADRHAGELYLIRDRLGKKPLYYSSDRASGRLAFASEFNAFRLKPERAHLNRKALVWYLSQKTAPQESSFDTRVKKLAPGSYLRYSPKGRVRVARYYSLAARPVKVAKTEAGVISDVESLLVNAVRLRMRADVEVGSFLSGGLDSSLIVALASRMTPRPLKTYCLVYKKNINYKAADARLARSVARRFGADHREVMLTPAMLERELPRIVKHYGQPNSAVIACWFIAREMGKKLKVALSGDGADELFGSYFLHRRAGAPAAKPRLAFERMLDRFAVFPDAELARLLRPGRYRRGEILEMLRERARQTVHRTGLNRMLEYDCRNLLVDQVLNYGDMLGMAHALEIRNPYLDHRLVDYAFSLDARYKIRGGETKYVLKRVAAQYLPAEIIRRPKEGFVEPAVYWIHREMKRFTLAHLESPRFDRHEMFNREYVRELTRSFYRKFDFASGKKIWNLLMYAIWEKYAG